MVNDKELASIIARRIFEVGGNHYTEPVLRIKFMIGKNPERDGGGFAERPLADFIESVLKEHRSY